MSDMKRLMIDSSSWMPVANAMMTTRIGVASSEKKAAL